MIFEIECQKCGKLFIIDCTQSAFDKGKYRKYCSDKCSHSRIFSDETKNKISKSLKKDRIVKCKVCGNLIVNKHKNKKCCSEKCQHISRLIPTLVKYFNLNIDFVGTDNIFEEIERIKNELFHEYWNNNLTGVDLGKKYDYPSPCNITGKIFKYLNIPTRNCKDTNKLNILNGKINPSTSHCNYKHGWHTTWNNKEVYLRSSYEFDYAKELDEQNINYEVENLRIKYWDSQKNEYRCAIPDFYLTETNTLVEIKSNYTLNKQEIIDKFNEYRKLGYNVKLILEHKETEI